MKRNFGQRISIQDFSQSCQKKKENEVLDQILFKSDCIN